LSYQRLHFWVLRGYVLSKMHHESRVHVSIECLHDAARYWWLGRAAVTAPRAKAVGASNREK
jgi:hypothetical protein